MEGFIQPENEAKARSFMDWYAANMDKLRYYVRGSGLDYDEDIFSGAFLRAYDAIARRGTSVKDNVGYFLQTYRATFLDSKKAPIFGRVDERIASEVPAPDFDSEEYERAAQLISDEMMDYVRKNYDEIAVSLFEIYVGLLPDISYARLSGVLRIPVARIWPVIGQIRKDLVREFGTAYNTFRSGIVDF